MQKKKRKSGSKNTYYRKEYICYNSRDEILITGTSKECAAYFGVTVGTLYSRVNRQDESKKNPNSKRQYFVYPLEEDEEDEILESLENIDSDHNEMIFEEIWEQYQDTDYEVSTYGNVRHVYKNGKIKIMAQWKKENKGGKGSKYLATKINGKEKRVSRMIYETFIGRVPAGYCLIHKDGDYKNNSLQNLEMIEISECGRYGAMSQSNGRKVYDEDNDCYYRSARDAAKHLYMSYQTVMDYCNKKVKKPMVSLRWADEVEK